MTTTAPAPTKNEALLEWVQLWSAILSPDRVEWCDGSEAQYESSASAWRRPENSSRSTRIPPDSFDRRSDPGDVARVEDRTFICCEKPEDVGPTNNWIDPEVMRAELLDLYRGAMRGRILYVHSILDGTYRQSDRPHRRTTQRLSLRCRLDAHHDPHG